MNDGDIGTVLADLLTEDEERTERGGEFRFDVTMLTERLTRVVDWLGQNASTATLPLGLFGASTGAAAALDTAAARPDIVRAVVSRGGRPDLAEKLEKVKAPTLLIVGGNDSPVIRLNEDAMESMNCFKRLEIVPGATHLFEEPGCLERAATLARTWFTGYLK